ncbi:hypothetical protein Btru_022265 [Bulinus truncatus]|nr:hypothetical protein Btru_022265 [Bulinus truncatus]
MELLRRDNSAQSVCGQLARFLWSVRLWPGSCGQSGSGQDPFAQSSLDRDNSVRRYCGQSEFGQLPVVIRLWPGDEEKLARTRGEQKALNPR